MENSEKTLVTITNSEYVLLDKKTLAQYLFTLWAGGEWDIQSKKDIDEAAELAVYAAEAFEAFEAKLESGK